MHTYFEFRRGRVPQPPFACEGQEVLGFGDFRALERGPPLGVVVQLIPVLDLPEPPDVARVLPERHFPHGLGRGLRHRGTAHHCGTVQHMRTGLAVCRGVLSGNPPAQANSESCGNNTHCCSDNGALLARGGGGVLQHAVLRNMVPRHAVLRPAALQHAVHCCGTTVVLRSPLACSALLRHTVLWYYGVPWHAVLRPAALQHAVHCCGTQYCGTTESLGMQCCGRQHCSMQCIAAAHSTVARHSTPCDSTELHASDCMPLNRMIQCSMPQYIPQLCMLQRCVSRYCISQHCMSWDYFPQHCMPQCCRSEPWYYIPQYCMLQCCMPH